MPLVMMRVYNRGNAIAAVKLKPSKSARRYKIQSKAVTVLN